MKRGADRRGRISQTQQQRKGAVGYFYWHGKGLKPGFRVLSGLLAASFFWQQVAWASPWELEKQNEGVVIPSRAGIQPSNVVNHRGMVEQNLGVVQPDTRKWEAPPPAEKALFMGLANVPVPGKVEPPAGGLLPVIPQLSLPKGFTGMLEYQTPWEVYSGLKFVPPEKIAHLKSP